MKSTTLLCFTLFLLATVSAVAQDESGALRLPNEGYAPQYETLIQQAQQDNMNAPAWRAFLEQHGGWKAMWNEWTHTPYRVWGEGVQVPGVSKVDASNADAVARTFLASVSDLLRLRDVELALVDVNGYEGKWTVSYHQQYKGLPVLFTEVTVSMSDGGRVFLFGSDVHPQLNAPVQPTISLVDAQTFAATGLTLAAGAGTGGGSGALGVLPYKSERGISYHLVYDVDVSQDEFHLWNVLVDAGDGRVLRRVNKVLDGISGNVQSSVKNVSVSAPANTLGVSNMYVKVNNVNVTTDVNGNYTSTNSGTVTVKFEGPYCKIQRNDGADAIITQTIANNQVYNLTWSGSNSTASERTAFWAVNRSREYILGLDNGITSLNTQILTKVNLPQTCNANYDGTGLNFYKAGTSSQGDCPNAAEMCDVVMHEYGHLSNDKIYRQFGATGGMNNGALNEGTADGFAALQLDRPEMGVGFFGNGTVLRNLVNTRRYPNDIIGEVHYDGEIIAGAIWDMRLNIGLSLAQHHAHYTRRAKPDDANTGKAYVKFFLEILKADDNDANLNNGTPNSSQIVPAFAKHGIPSGMLTMTHTRVSSSPANSAIPLTCAVTSAMTEISVTELKVYYRATGGTWNSAAMTMTSGQANTTSNWSGSIPAQNAGTLLQYYIEAKEGWGSARTLPVNGSSDPYRVLIGFTSYTIFDFESAMGWQGHVGGDDAMTGKWILADPVGTTSNSAQVQPENDHSPSGTKCWVTGNGAVSGAAGDQDVDNGVTSVLSPALALASLNTPVIRYWRWFSNDLGASPGGDPWQVKISGDDGATWVDVENTLTSFNYWNENIIVVSDYVTPTNTVRMRFIASDEDPQSLVEAALDDFEILHLVNVPVELSALSASRVASTVSVEWSTASERNNQGFEVEYRAVDAGEWTLAGFVAGAGSSLRENRYSFRFEETSGRDILVRLRQIDADGKVTPSPEVLVAGRAQGFAMHQNYPNPAGDATILPFELSRDGNASIVLRNVLGAEVLRTDLGALRSGGHAVPLRLGGLPAGVYTCQLEAEGAVLSQRLVIRR